MKILVTGAMGQLGTCIKAVTEKYATLEFSFKSSKDLDISNAQAVHMAFTNNKYDYCINCAAYTQVDNAEDEKEKATAINVNGAQNLAKACAKTSTVLIHISTDFVFDGKKKIPYTEDDKVGPTGVYGQTKYLGEQQIQKNLKHYFIIRTSWLYSEFGHNFMKTMLRLGKEKDELSVVNDQIGTPTYAVDLAAFILRIITLKSDAYGLYHYSNEGVASWYDFAKTIFDLSNTTINLKSVTGDAYPTKAERPKYSVLDKAKVKDTFKIRVPSWEDGLQRAIKVNKL